MLNHSYTFVRDGLPKWHLIGQLKDFYDSLAAQWKGILNKTSLFTSHPISGIFKRTILWQVSTQLKSCFEQNLYVHVAFHIEYFHGMHQMAEVINITTITRKQVQTFKRHSLQHKIDGRHHTAINGTTAAMSACLRPICRHCYVDWF